MTTVPGVAKSRTQAPSNIFRTILPSGVRSNTLLIEVLSDVLEGNVTLRIERVSVRVEGAEDTEKVLRSHLNIPG